MSTGASDSALTQPPRRIRALDGVRGVAALVVVFHHSLLQDPSLFPGDPASHGWAWWVAFSPLHLIWDGTEAVFVFFVLSGYVLTLPMVGRRRDLAGWLAYYPQRLLRLYLPVFASVVLAVLSYEVVRRHVVGDATWWLSAHAEALTPGGVAHDLTLVRGTTWVNSALWSLRWEVVFSVALPVYIAAAVVARRWWWLKVLLLLVAVAAGERGGRDWLTYLPMFGLGVVLAMERARLGTIARRLGTRAWWSLTVVALLMLNSYWTFLAVGAPHKDTIGRALEVLGACLAVFIVVEWGRARQWAERPSIQWLGTRSFSLYLVHEPIVVSVAFLFLRPTDPLPTLLVGVPLALAVAEVFHRVVEAPSHRLSRRAGQLTRRHVARLGIGDTSVGAPSPAAETS